MSSTVPGYYTVQEAAPILDRTPAMVCRYIKQGLLPAMNLGHQLLIEQSAVHEFEPPPRGNPNFRKDDDNPNGTNNL